MMNDTVARPGTPVSGAANPGPAETRHPGRLRGEAMMTIQTRKAQALFHGRRRTEDREAIIGLARFASLSHLIWQAAAADDPFADWMLLQIETTLSDTHGAIREAVGAYQERLSAIPAIEIEVAYSVEPVRVPLSFSTVYGYQGAYLLTDFDELVRTVLTAMHVGLEPRGTGRELIERHARAIRRTFLLPTRWKYKGVTREDVEQMNARALDAIAAMASMGELPAAVLAGERRANHAPEIRKPTRPTTTDTAEVGASAADDEADAGDDDGASEAGAVGEDRPE